MPSASSLRVPASGPAQSAVPDCRDRRLKKPTGDVKETGSDDARPSVYAAKRPENLGTASADKYPDANYY